MQNPKSPAVNATANPPAKRGRRTRNRAATVPPPPTNPPKPRRGRRNNQALVYGPQAIAGVGLGNVLEVTNTRTHSVPEIREGEELIASVGGSVSFAVTQFNINPANAVTFPWLSKIAQLFERYEFESLSFHFGHEVSGFATQGQTGLVYLSALYDAASAAPSTVQQIEATDPFVPCMPNQDSCLRLDRNSMHPARTPKFCLQSNGPPAGTDIKSYNVGSMFFSTTGMSNTTEIGKLRVKYRVKLYDRLLDASQNSAPANFSVSQFAQSNIAAAATGNASTVIATTVINNGAGVNTVGGVYTLPVGNWTCDWTVDLDVTTGLGPCSLFSNLLVNGVPVSPGISQTSPLTASNSIVHLCVSGNWFVQSTGSTTVALSLTAIYPGGTTADYDVIFRFSAV